MTKYIEREALLEKSFCTAPATMINPYGGQSVVSVEDIENAPAVDVVKVVRCKDCRHYNSYGYLYNPEDLLYRCSFGIFNNQRQNKDSDYYCSYGELRTDE